MWVVWPKDVKRMLNPGKGFDSTMSTPGPNEVVNPRLACVDVKGITTKAAKQ